MSANLAKYLESAKNGPLPGETEAQFRDRIVQGALAIQGKLDLGERSVIAEPMTFDEISTPGSTPQTYRIDAEARERFKTLHDEAVAIQRAANRRALMVAIAGLAVAGTVAAGGVPSIGAIASLAVKGISALLADGNGQDVTEDSAPAT